jgi:hypothetical protein
MKARLTSLLGSSLLLAIGVTGCHHGGETPAPPPPDMAQAPDLLPPPPDMLLPDRDPTDHPQALQVMNYGGATIAAIEPYTIVWKGDEALGMKVHTFLSYLVQSDYWVAVTAEYGGGKGTPQSLIVLDDAAPTTLDDSQMDDIVNGLVTSGKLPSTTINTMLFFVVPQSTKSTLYGANGCYDYGGYHAETQVLINGRHQPYALNLQCMGSALASSSGFDSLTVTLSHEAVEAQTDPHPFSAPGWLNADAPMGGEVGDLCVFSDTTITAPGGSGQPDTTYAVTTIYSEAAAKAGNKEPCQPSPAGQPFYSVAVNPPEVVVVTDASGIGDAEAAYEPFAFGDVGTIRWSIEQPPGQGIKVTPSSGQAKAGETLRMKVHVGSQVRSGSYPLVIGVHSDKAQKTNYTATITVQ